MPFRLALFALAAALCIVVSGAVSVRAVWTLVDAMGWVAHTHEVIATLDAMLAAATSAESAGRAYLLTGDERVLAGIGPARTEALAHFQAVRRLTSDNPQQQGRLQQLDGVLSARLALLDELVQLRADGGRPTLQAVAQQGVQRMQQVRAEVDVLRGAEQALLQQRMATAEQARQAGLTSVVASSGLGLLALAVLFLASRRHTGQLAAEHDQLLRSREQTLEQAHALADANAQLREAAGLLEHRVQERTEALQEANQELRAFAHTVAHDLRAPLRNVQGFAAALLEDERDRLSEEGRQYAERLGQVTARMDRLISDLLEYAWLSREELGLGDVELSQVLATVMQDLQATIQAQGAVVDVPNDPPAVRAHFATLVQVLANLIGNGLKFHAPGVVPHVTVTASTVADRVLITVADNGIGIAPEHQDRIFHVFERLHGEERYAGTGIGLAIVRKGVERMRGSVHVDSAPGYGARFTLDLPAAAQALH